MCKKLLFLAIFSIIFNTGCFVESTDYANSANLVLELEFPAMNRLKSETVDLTESDIVVHVVLKADDFTEPLSDSWSGEMGAQEVVELELVAPAGKGRQLSIVAYLKNNDTIYAYDYFQDDLEFGAGNQEIQCQLTPKDTYALEGTITTADSTPLQVRLKDITADVLFPPVTVVQRTVDNSFIFNVPEVPVGRFFYLLVRFNSSDNWETLEDYPVYYAKSGVLNKTIEL
ncbi:MAG: hypothetical protein PF689_01015 [Deltaproteobacteria bacterium]|jgi:hypothetical protein|nr:hypothetical protein [Deltaproteobacteria bacterium]